MDHWLESRRFTVAASGASAKYGRAVGHRAGTGIGLVQMLT